MVAPKRGRGARNQAAKPKVASAEDAVQETEVANTDEPMEESNGAEVTEQVEQADAADTATDAPTDASTDTPAETPKEEPKPEEKPEEKVEAGKLLVENLPSTFLFDYQDRIKELFSKHGEVTSVKRGPIIVTELTTTPTLSAIVEFKNKDSVEKALVEGGTIIEGHAISVAPESRPETAVLVGVPHEASTQFVRELFTQCGEVAHIHEFSKTKYKILRVTFISHEGVERALKLDRELRVNGFMVTVSKYRDDDQDKAQHNVRQYMIRRENKRQHSTNQSAGATPNRNNNPPLANNGPARNNNFNARPRGAGGAPAFNARGNFRGARGRGGFGGRGGAFPRGGFAPAPAYLPPQGFMGRPGGFMNDGQRPNKRLRQM